MGDALEASLAEYNSLCSEQMARLEAQNQAFQLLLGVIAAAAAAVAATADKPGLHVPVLIVTFLTLPLISGPLGFIFFDNEMAIYSIGSRLHADIRPRIAALSGDPGALGNALEFKNLHPRSAFVHGLLSRARWTLFLATTVLPTAASVFMAAGRPGTEILRFSGAGTAALPGVGVAVWAADVLICLLLLRAIAWSFQKFHRPAEHGKGSA